jgi:hypothetical protein
MKSEVPLSTGQNLESAEKVVPGFFRVTCVGRSATDEAAANRIRRVRDRGR